MPLCDTSNAPADGLVDAKRETCFFEELAVVHGKRWGSYMSS